MVKNKMRKNILCLLTGLCINIPVAQAQQSITFAGWGGALQDAEREAYFKPAAKKLNIVIKEDNVDGLPAVRAQVMSGKPKWDIVELGSSDCAIAQKQGLTEPLNFGLINVKDIDKRFYSKNWVASNGFATVLAWATDTGRATPKNWQEFFNPNLQGARALYRQPYSTLELALMADGVNPRNLYPLDVERAFKVLERIRPQVVNWWKTGSDSVQLLRNGEVDFMAIWSGRVYDLKQAGNAVDYTYDKALLNFDCLVIPKGSSNKDLAMKVIAEIMTPESQAGLAALIPYSPINPKAYETGIIPEKMLGQLPTAPAHIDNIAIFNPEWWLDHQAKLQRRFDLFIQK